MIQLLNVNNELMTVLIVHSQGSKWRNNR